MPRQSADHQRRYGACGYSARVVQWLTGLGACVILGVLALGAMVLFDGRRDAWRQAEQASANLAVSLERDIGRNIALYDLSVQGALEAVAQPGIDRIPPEIRRLAIFDRAASAEYLGSLLVVDAAGNIVADSTSLVPPKLNLADRDYFVAHRNSPGMGLFLSRPFLSRLQDGDPSIAISRRLSGSDGRFLGVAVGVLRLAYFQDLFEKLNVGPHGAVALFRSDGRVVARNPLRPGDIDMDVSRAEVFRKFIAAPSGSFTGTAALDGVKRLYTFRHIGDVPLIIGVAVAVEDVYAAWWHKALVIGSMLVVLCLATTVLCLLFRREMFRRIAAENALREAAVRLAEMAETDGLTGLANRRAFEASLQGEWKRAIRSQSPVALLMIDADQFKPYNDRFGHQEGDRALQAVAGCIGSNVCRPGDTAARYGGEEFAVILSDTDLTGALEVAERIRASVAALAIRHPEAQTGRMTVSIGAAAIVPRQENREGLLVREADAALYTAKRNGRNQVRVGGAGAHPAMV